MVPAQILTIEDTIAGNLTMKQLALIGVSVLGSGSIYFLIEPANKVSLLKFLLLAVFNAVVLGSAIRLKGVLLMDWAFVGLVYMLRPRYWIYDKASTYLRITEQTKADSREEEVTPERVPVAPVPAVDIAKQVEIERMLRDPSKRVRFINTKGGAKIVFTAEAK